MAMIATIRLAGTVTAQGPVVQSHADGRITIADGLRRFTDWPVERGTLTAIAVAMMAVGGSTAQVRAETFLNISHDPTRELYREVNAAFTAAWIAAGNAAP